MLDHDRYNRHPIRVAPTGWRRNSLIGVTAAVLMTAGLLVAAATADGAHAATVDQLPGTDRPVTHLAVPAPR